MTATGRSKEQDFWAKGKVSQRILPSLLLIFAWFSPHRRIRAFFHKKRGVRMGKNVEIGYFCIIGNVHPELITIEDNAVVTARVTILEHDNAMYYTGRGDVVSGPVVIGKNAFIGIGATIMPNVTIGERSIVAPYAFVNRDVPDNTLAAGSPAKVVKKYDN